jgi:uncharacterized FlaG/YvyC family protein
MAPTVKEEIVRLQKIEKEENERKAGSTDIDEEKNGSDNEQAVAQRLDRLEHLIQEMNDRLKSIESHLSQN